MDKCPVFCLKTDTDSDGTLRLVNEDGVGNGVPARSSFGDLDHRYNYSTGDVGKVPLRLPHQLTISMDEVMPATREALLDWKFKRRKVTLCDTLGLQVLDETNYLMKPKDHVSGIYADETGKHSLEVGFDNLKYVWDFLLKKMITRSVDELVTERTAFGDGFRGHGPVGNLGSPGSPESALTGFGTGKCGWDLSLGAGLASGYLTDFPNDDYPGNMRIYSTSDGAGTLEIPATQLGAAPFSGEGSFVFIVWVKGTPGRNASALSGSAGNYDSKDLSGKVYDDWTPLFFRSHLMDWTGISPNVLLVLNNGTDENTNFYIGPHMACFVEGDDQYVWPHWCFDSTAILTADGYLGTKSFVPMPSAGTMTLDFVIPDNLDLFSMEGFHIGLAEFGAAAGYGRWTLIRSDSGNIQLRVGNTVYFYTTISDEKLLAPGRHIWAVTYDSSANEMNFIADGRVQEEQSINVSSWSGSAAVARMGKSNPYSSAGIYFLGMRLDDSAFNSAEIALEQAAVMDNVARGIYELSQGRWYEIVSVPQIPLIQDGPSLFMGDLVLKQVSYLGGSIWYAQEES